MNTLQCLRQRWRLLTEKYRFAVLNGTESLTEFGLQSYCQQRLPAVLVPEHVIFMAELPRNFVGKVLRRQLMQTTQPISTPES